MSVSLEQIEHLARLARLELTAKEKTRYQKDISGILEYVAKVQAVKTPSDLPLEHSLPVKNFRPDETLECSVEEKQAIIGSFPEAEGNLAKVKAVFE